MTKMYRPHYGADPISRVLALEMVGSDITRASCLTANIPSGKKGYAKGCTLQVTDGATGSTLYQNEGSNTSCSFAKVGSTATGSPLVLNGVTYTSMQLNSIEALRFDDATISGMVANGQTAGVNTFIASQDGGADSALTGGKNGGSITITAGAGSSAGNNGGSGNVDGASGSIVLKAQAAPSVGDSGSGAKPGSISLNAAGGVFFKQAAPVAKSTTTPTLAVADLLTGIVTSTNASAVTATLDTGTLMDAGVDGTTLGVDVAFDWSLENLGSSSGAATVTASSGHTVVGNMVVAITTTGRFRSRRTAAATWITYRLA